MLQGMLVWLNRALKKVINNSLSFAVISVIGDCSENVKKINKCYKMEDN